MCEEWTVADVVAHLAQANKSHAGWIEEALSTDAVKRESFPRRTNDRIDATGLAERVISLRKELGDYLLVEFVKANRATEGILDQVGPEDWDKLCYRGLLGAEPIRNILDTFIADVGVHRWDVNYPFDPSVKLSPDCLLVMVERYPHRPRWWEIKLPSNHPALPVRFRFKVTNVAVLGTDFVISTAGEKYMEVAGNALANVTFSCNAETFVLVAYGRISPESACSDGMLSFRGDQKWADIFIRSYVGG